MFKQLKVVAGFVYTAILGETLMFFYKKSAFKL